MSGTRIVRRTTVSATAGVVVLLGIPVLVSVPWWAGEARLRDLIEFFTLLALAQMWNLLAGYAGLVSIGQQAFIGLGGYGLYLIADRGGVEPFLAILLAGLAAAAISLLIAPVVFRLRGGYFAIGTWVVAEVFLLLSLNGADLHVDVGGGVGTIISSAAQIERGTRYDGAYWWSLGIGAGSVLITYAILRSRIGLALTAIRDDEAAARSLGVNVLRTKVLVWAIAAFVCGATGAVVYLNLVRIEPQAAYTVNWTAFMIFIVVIGGIGTIEGPILGTVIFFVLQKQLADYGSWYLIILGSVAVLVAVFARSGLWGAVGPRFGVHLFPVRRQVVFPEPSTPPPGTAPSRP